MPSENKPRFSVQAFQAKGKGLEPEAAQPADDAAHAVRKAERLATGKAGAVAIRHDDDPGTGDFREPVVLRVIGRVPEVFLDDVPF